MNELTLHQKQMKEIGDENRRLSLKLKEVRTIMRQHGIGNLYPGTTEEHERNVEIASQNPENYFALQQVAFHNSAVSEAWKRVAHNISAWLQLNHPEVRIEMPSQLFQAEIAMELDVKKLLKAKKGPTIASPYSPITRLINE